MGFLNANDLFDSFYVAISGTSYGLPDHSIFDVFFFIRIMYVLDFLLCSNQLAYVVCIA